MPVAVNWKLSDTDMEWSEDLRPCAAAFVDMRVLDTRYDVHWKMEVKKKGRGNFRCS
jgi:hypothetical protein